MLNKVSGIFLTVLFLLVLITGCEKEQFNQVQTYDNYNLLAHLKENNELKLENEVEVNGVIENDLLIVRYRSVDPDQYFKAFEEHATPINYFTRQSRINEDFQKGVTRKEDSLLVVKTSDKDITFKDNGGSRTKFFYEGQLSDYHIVKSFEFEDAYTYFVNKWTGNVDYKMRSTLVEYESEENLVLYSDGMAFGFDHQTELSILKLNEFSMDTLLTDQNLWMASKAFFINENEIYYIHTAYGDGDGFKSTYAKMEIIRK